MTRTFLYILGTGTAVALTLASACTVTSNDDDDTIVGAGGSTSPTTTSQTTGGNGGAGAQGGAGVGGSANCISCSEYLADPNATEEELCGFQAGGCAPDSSCALALEFSVCVCGESSSMPGACLEQCTLSCTGAGMDDGCEACYQSDCAGPLSACETDTGG